MDFAELAGRVEKNVLGRLMHGQRELFHSNLLAWFFETLPDAADAVFLPLSAPGAGAARLVERERQNMDLVLRWPDRAPLVIENKVFAMPDVDQLDEYAQLAAAWRGSPPAFCLLAMSAPVLHASASGNLVTQNGWQYISYAELARRIEAALPAVESYEVETMRRYAALIGDLQQLISAVDVTSDQEEAWLPKSMLGAVGSSQTRAALQKARSQRIASALRRDTSGRGRSVGHGMTRSVALVESFEHVLVQGIDLWAGWQLQGPQFRRVVIFTDPALQGGSPAAREQRASLARSLPELFTLPTVLSATPAGRNEFNHYAPNFVYQYGKVPSLRLDALLQATSEIHTDLARFESVHAEPLDRSHVRTPSH
ncbi:hypothetical protein C5C69_06555 [Rathayibacter sp. AY1C7]|uniref:PD-(D/E)XK nuclease family protein n=1 Tax=Rathayibacter sp. AY1C7 TaxID=2080540 RepID=UPI000CE7CAC8|nr:PD-(D/E)XK nuclease family protein [Rathayibacter sp. AY1C7]PPG61969.1 hypothetical protein C5C69_06555 [Rathayibacter sp. AY1C7]